MAGRRDKERKPRRWWRWLGRLALAGAVLVVGLWIAVHRIPWLGPAIADGIRAVLGPAPVAWLEDVAYGIQDRVNLWRYEGEPPKTFWDAPPALPDPAASPPAFEVARFAPPFPEVATPADGIWLAMPPASEGADVVAYKSIVHPDPRRGFAALAVVAMDMKALDLHLVAGTSEPFSMTVPQADRPGLVPAAHAQHLFAAFNGGFKATHGQYGMFLDGVEFLPPRDIGCTFARFRDGSYRIATWTRMKGEAAQMRYYRQTPPCLVEDGKIHDTLAYQEYAKGWGATVSGDTIIRRSAIGLDREGKVLFYGLGEAMTAQALAKGMAAAGAYAAAELDVNYSYPRFLLYEHPEPGKPPIAASAIIPAIDFTKWQYVGQASPRDFFYLTRQRTTAGVDRRDGDATVAANER